MAIVFKTILQMENNKIKNNLLEEHLERFSVLLVISFGAFIPSISLLIIYSILKYLHENRCTWNEKSCEYASIYGQLECLKYLHDNGCPWNEKSCERASD